MKKKVAVIGTVGIPACYGGFESLVENLTLNKGDDIEYQVFCSSSSYRTKLESYNDAKLIYLPFKANGAQSILYDIFSLIRCVFLKPSVVVILGVSGCIALPFFRLFYKGKIITNIDGLEWKRDKWGARVRCFLKYSEAKAVKYSDIVITDNQAITDYVLQEYKVESQTIAYGGDHALRSLTVSSSLQSYALGLCRIEPENNVELILSAFSLTTARLKFVGNWGASEFGRRLKKSFSGYKNIELIDPVYDLDDLYELRKNCSIYIHGHSAGGTNPSLVEMMHFGVPILAYDCNFNRYSTEEKACYFDSEKKLIQLLNESCLDILEENGKAMKEVATRRYTWSQITKMYEATYA